MSRLRREFVLLAIPGVILLGGLCLLLMNSAGTESAPQFSRLAVAPTAAPEPEPIQPRPVGPRATETPAASSAPGQPAEIQIADVLPRLPEGTVEFQVLDPDGNPVRHATVTVMERPNFQLPGIPTALLGRDELGTIDLDDEARARLTKSEGLDLEVVVAAQGFASKRYRLRDPGRRILQIEHSAAIWGTVYDEDDRPIEGVEVLARHDGADDEVRTVTHSDGTYTFEGVTPSAVTIRVASPDFERAYHHVRVEGGVRYRRNFTLRDGRPLFVTVKDGAKQVVAEAEIRLVELNSDLQVGRVMSGQDGDARFGSLRVGRRYMLMVQHADHGVARHLVFQGRPVEDDGAPLVEQIALVDHWTLNGHLTSPEGVAIPGARIILESGRDGVLGSSKHRMTGRSNEDGTFSIDGLLPDTSYNAYVYHPHFAIGLSQGLKDGDQPVIRLPGKSTVTGTIVDQNEKPIPNAVIFLTFENSSVVGAQLIGRTDRHGNYTFSNVPPGRFHVEALSLTRGMAGSPSAQVIGEQTVSRHNLRVDR